MTNPLLKIFGRSPIRPLQAHMAKVHECVALLKPFFEAVLANDHERADGIQEQIGALENEADAQKHDLRLHLPRSLFLPVERRDVLEVLTMQDSVANRAKDIAGLVRGRHIALPEEIGQLFLEFVERSIEASEQAKKTVNELDELIETGFRGSEVELVQRMIEDLDTLEKATDEIQIEVRAKLFAMEKSLDPIDVMFLYRVIDWTGDIGDRAQRVGSRLQLMLAQ